MNGGGQGYPTDVMPDDTAGRPLTPGEQAAIADLEQRLRDKRAPVRNLAIAPPVRAGRPSRRRSPLPLAAAGPLVALLGVACVLVAVLGVIGVGVLGAAAALASVVATAVVWMLLPLRFGGGGRRARRTPRTGGHPPRRSR